MRAANGRRRRARPRRHALRRARDRAHRSHRAFRGGRASAASRVTSVDKANVLDTGRLWRKDRASRSPRSTHEVDVTRTCSSTTRAMQTRHDHPGQFDVIVAENTLGDILSDEAVGARGLARAARARRRWATSSVAVRAVRMALLPSMRAKTTSTPSRRFSPLP